VVEGAKAGYDRVYASTSYSILGQDNIEELRLLEAAGVSSAEGNQGANTLVGNASNNSQVGRGGDDTLIGNGGNDVILGGEGDDTLDGGAGVDTLIGGVGRNVMTGRSDADLFVFHATADMGLTEGTADVVTDFSFAVGDRIALSAIDANGTTGANDAFTFIGMAAFSGTPGEIRYCHAGGNTYLEMQAGVVADVEGVICLQSIHDPEAFWFIV
jgi:serralysin